MRDAIRFFLRRFFRRADLDRDLQAELDSHIRLAIRERMEQGESQESARGSVFREFGNGGLVAEVTRDMWGFTWLEQALQDSRYAFRMLLKSPGLTLTVMLMLALGIGGATAVFTFVNGILLRPLPFPSARQLVMISELSPLTGNKPDPVLLNNFVAWKERSHSFQSMAAFFTVSMNILSPHEVVQLPGLAVTSEFFSTLGTPPLLGRTFRPGEYYGDKPREVVLSYTMWQSRFGGRPDVIGKKISLNATHHQIIGVMPPGFGFPNLKAYVYVPLAIDLNEGRNYSVVARLRPGISVTTAKAEISAIATQTARENAALDAGWSATVVPLLEQTVGPIRPILLALFAAIGLILLLACANIANLLLMRSARRAREITVRLALGAGKFRIVRQLLIENLLLATLGGSVGIALAAASVPLVRHSLPETLQIPRLQETTLDPSVLAFSIAVTLLSCLFFGLVPSLQTLKRDLVHDLHAVTRSITAGRNLRQVLVIAEVALAVILVVVAGLMVRSFNRLLSIDSGFHPEHVLTVRMLLLPVEKEQFHAEVVDDMLKRIRALPGVVSAGSIGILPMEGTNSGTWYYRADGPEPPVASRPAGDVSIITPGYFRTLGIPILRGRDFDEHDRAASQPVAILNEAAARMFFPHENPIGKRLKVWWGNPAPIVEVVGVAHDIRHSELTSPPAPCLFMPNDQRPFALTSLVVRTLGDSLFLTKSITRQIREVDSDQGVAKVETMTELVANSIARPRAETFLLTAFGSLALLIACVGLYGVIAYSATQRSREIGIRLALGATSSSVFRAVLADGFRLTIIGLLAGLAGALFLTRYVRALLFEIEPSDPATLVSVAALVAFVSLVASYWPAHRAMKVDPAVMLHEE